MVEASAAWRRWRRCFHWRPRDWPLGYLSAVCTFLNGSDGASTISVLTTSNSIRLYSPAPASGAERDQVSGGSFASRLGLEETWVAAEGGFRAEGQGKEREKRPAARSDGSRQGAVGARDGNGSGSGRVEPKSDP
jgi:hypothetical protein